MEDKPAGNLAILMCSEFFTAFFQRLGQQVDVDTIQGRSQEFSFPNFIRYNLMS